MRYVDKMVVYNRGGPIAVGPWPDKAGWSDHYTYSVGGCELRVQKATKTVRSIIMLLDFHHAVVRDKVPIMEAQKAFMNFAEFRDMMACDVPQ